MSAPPPCIYLARHGEPAWPRPGQHPGLPDIPPTPAGTPWGAGAARGVGGAPGVGRFFSRGPGAWGVLGQGQGREAPSLRLGNGDRPVARCPPGGPAMPADVSDALVFFGATGDLA